MTAEMRAEMRAEMTAVLKVQAVPTPPTEN